MEARNQGVDLARCAAVLLVIGYHALCHQTTWLGTLGGAGWMGVDLFFVMSGFLVVRGFEDLREKGAGVVASFFRKRFFRIVPAYLATVIITTGFAMLFEPVRSKALANLLPLLVFAGNFVSLVASVLWSISVEVQFYLILPLLLGPLALGERIRRHPLPWLVFLLALPLGGRILAYSMFSPELLSNSLQDLSDPSGISSAYGSMVYANTLLHGDGLLIGLWLGVVARGQGAWVRSIRDRRWMVLGALGTLGLIYALLAPWRTFMPRPWILGVFGFTAVALASAWLLVGLIQHEGFRLKGRFWIGVQWLSDRIYSLYLAQAITSLLMGVVPWRTLPPLAGAILAGVYIVLTLIIGSGLYRWVERPCLRSQHTPRALKGAPAIGGI